MANACCLADSIVVSPVDHQGNPSAFVLDGGAQEFVVSFGTLVPQPPTSAMDAGLDAAVQEPEPEAGSSSVADATMPTPTSTDDASIDASMNPPVLPADDTPHTQLPGCAFTSSEQGDVGLGSLLLVAVAMLRRLRRVG